MKRRLAAAAVAALAFATQAHANSGVVAVYETSPQTLWETVDFHQPSENFMPPVASSARTGKGVGAIKLNTLAGGGGAKVRLQLVHYDPAKREFTYAILESPLPVKNYLGIVKVTAAGPGKAQLSWQGLYEPKGLPAAKADEILSGFYASIANKIGEKFKRVK